MTYQQLPPFMQNDWVHPWVEYLRLQKRHLTCKRIFDIVLSLLILIITSPFFLLLAIAIKLDSPGPVFYRQVRVGLYGQDFRIFKFRTMVQNADKMGLSLTTGKDPRITRVGRLIRKCRLDEFSQILNVLKGDMSLVGPRPEVRKYVEAYEQEAFATLLIRPGITAPASIYFRNEDELLEGASDPETVYIEKILPKKCRLNLQYMERITVFRDIRILFQTVAAVFYKKGDKASQNPERENCD